VSRAPDTDVWLVLHVPNTGGETLRDELDRQLVRGRSHVRVGNDRGSSLKQVTVAGDPHPNRLFDEPQELLGAFAGFDRDALDQVRALSGHPVGLALSELFPERPVRSLVFVRRPVDRIVSHYNYAAGHRASAGLGHLDFELWYANQPSNFQMRYLAQRLMVDPTLNAVLEGLAALTVVGRTERLDDLLPLLFAAMDLDPPGDGRSNVAGRDHDRLFDPDAARRARLAEENALDMMLYSCVAELEPLGVARLEGLARRRRPDRDVAPAPSPPEASR